MMPPNARTAADVHRETGVSEPTLYAWRREFQNRGHAVPANPANPESWSGRDKLAVVIETAALNEHRRYRSTAGVRGCIPSRSSAGRKRPWPAVAIPSG